MGASSCSSRLFAPTAGPTTTTTTGGPSGPLQQPTLPRLPCVRAVLYLSLPHSCFVSRKGEELCYLHTYDDRPSHGEGMAVACWTPYGVHITFFHPLILALNARPSLLPLVRRMCARASHTRHGHIKGVFETKLHLSNRASRRSIGDGRRRTCVA
jgi:hypothetical protein